MEPLTMGALAAGMGMVLQPFNDARQYRQQKRLQKLQIAGQKEMMDYAMAAQYDMWDKTNYHAQMAQLKKAGLNPALLYGMKGGGGITTGNPQGNVTGGQAASGGGKEMQELMGMGMNMELMKAQKQLIQAQAENVKADTAKKTGVETENLQTQTQLLAQELDNKREDFQIKRLQQTMMNIENFEKQTSQVDRLHEITYQAQKAFRELNILTNTQKISEATTQEQINIIQQQSINAIIQNEATQNNIELTKAQMQKITQEIIASKKELTLKEVETIFRTNFPSIGQAAGRIFNDAIESIYKLIAGQRTPHYSPKQ